MHDGTHLFPQVTPLHNRYSQVCSAIVGGWSSRIQPECNVNSIRSQFFQAPRQCSPNWALYAASVPLNDRATTSLPFVLVLIREGTPSANFNQDDYRTVPLIWLGRQSFSTDVVRNIPIVEVSWRKNIAGWIWWVWQTIQIKGWTTWTPSPMYIMIACCSNELELRHRPMRVHD